MNDYVALGARTSAGLLAGLYFGFTVAVMPALHGLGDAAFVDTMKRINVSIVNPVFLLVSSPLPCWPLPQPCSFVRHSSTPRRPWG